MGFAFKLLCWPSFHDFLIYANKHECKTINHAFFIETSLSSLTVCIKSFDSCKTAQSSRILGPVLNQAPLSVLLSLCILYVQRSPKTCFPSHILSPFQCFPHHLSSLVSPSLLFPLPCVFPSSSSSFQACSGPRCQGLSGSVVSVCGLSGQGHCPLGPWMGQIDRNNFPT